MSKRPRVEAFVLAGGKSSRMGSDKGLIDFRGKPMISYVLEALRETKLPVKIIANNPEYEKFGLPVRSDVVKGVGPIGGLATAFANTDAEVVMLLSCDMPFLNGSVLNQLVHAAAKDFIAAALVKNKINPLLATYPVHLSKAVDHSIAAGTLKMTEFVLKNPHTLVTSVGKKMPWCFQNINNREELKEAEEKWSHLL